MKRVESVIYARASTWSDYTPESWPYNFLIENAYVRGIYIYNLVFQEMKLSILGICNEVDHEKRKVSIEYHVFDQCVRTNFAYLKKHCSNFLPAGNVHYITGPVLYRN